MNYTTPDDNNQLNSLKFEEKVPDFPDIQNIPSDLAAWNQWTCWDYGTSSLGPCRNPAGSPGSLQDALKRCESHHYGLGFALRPDDPFCAIRVLDSVYQDKYGKLVVSDAARELESLAGTYAEFDVNLHDMHLIGIADSVENASSGNVEVHRDTYLLPITGVPYRVSITGPAKCSQSFLAIQRDYCPILWMSRLKAMQGEEKAALTKLLDEFLPTPDWYLESHNPDQIEFLGHCFKYSDFKLRVRNSLNRMGVDWATRDLIFNVADARANELTPGKKRKEKAAPSLDSEVDGGGAEQSEMSFEDELIYDSKCTKILENFYNMSMILQHHEEWKGRLKFDTFQNNVILDNEHPLSDAIEHRITEWFGKYYRFGGNSSIVIRKGIHAASTMHTYDPLYDFMKSLPKWDGVSRLKTWMIDMCGSPHDELSKWMSYMTIMQMVARAMNPGCMARNVPVWEGLENKGKTRMIKLLGDPWSITFDMSMESKEAHMAIQGVWVAELAELDTLRRTTETRLKSFISQTKDTFVPKYSNNRASYPRRTVFFGTTNDEDYLASVTGNTRWFPIATGDFDYDRMEKERFQLFAESLSIFEENPDVTWWDEPADIQEMLKKARKQRRSFNVYEDSLCDWLDGLPPKLSSLNPNPNPIIPIRRNEVSWQDIAKDFLKLEDPEKWKDRSLQMQITSAIKGLGWTKKRNSDTTSWIRPEGESNQEDVPF